MPTGWPEAAAGLAEGDDPALKQAALALSAVFGDPSALASLRAVVLDTGRLADERSAALRILVDQREEGLPRLLQGLLDDSALRSAAIRGLAAFDDPATPAQLVERYGSLSDEEKADCVNTLSVRPAYALALLDAIEQGAVPRTDVTPFTARQLLGMEHPDVGSRLTQVWGAVRPAAEGKAELLARYRTLLAPENVQAADVLRGRALFAKNCAACHVLFGAGGRIGPELTGAQRTNLDYVLENLLDPSAVVPRDYQVTHVETADGRVVTGIVRQENEAALTLQTPNDVVVVPKTDIEERRQTPLSMMPEGLLSRLADDEVRDLVSYLASPAPPAE
jgi:putative heme-binding domain-containing protein